MVQRRFTRHPVHPRARAFTRARYIDSEISIMGRLRRHPNIVALHGVYETPSYVYLVEEL